MLTNGLNKLKKIKDIKFIKDVSVLQAGSMVGTILSVLASVVFARILGPSVYGSYSLIFAFSSLIGIFMSWGASYGGLTLFADAYSKKDKIEVKKVIIYFLKISLLSTILISIIAIIFAPDIAKTVYKEAHIGYLARWIIAISVLKIFYSLIIIILQSLRKIKYLTILENTNKVLYAAIPALLVVLGFGLKGIIFGHVITAFLFFFFSIGLYVVFSKRNYLLPKTKEILEDFFKIKVKKYFTFGFLIALDKNLSSLYVLLPTIIAGAFISTQEIAFFKIATGLVGISLVVLTPVSRLLNVQLPQSKNQSLFALKRAFYKSTLGSFLISIPIAIVLIILYKPLIIFFYGKEFVFSSQLMYVLAIYVMLSGLGVGLGAIYRTLDKIKTLVKINSLLLIIGLPICYLIIKTYGIWGLSITYVLWRGSANLVSLIVISKYLKKIKFTENKI